MTSLANHPDLGKVLEASIGAALREPVALPDNLSTAERAQIHRTLMMREAYLAKLEGRATARQLRFLKRTERPAIRQSILRHVARQQKQTPGWSRLRLLRSAQTEFELWAERAAKTGQRVFIHGIGALDHDECRKVAAAARELIAEITRAHPKAADDTESPIELDSRSLIRRDRAYESTAGPPGKHPKRQRRPSEGAPVETREGLKSFTATSVSQKSTPRASVPFARRALVRPGGLR